MGFRRRLSRLEERATGEREPPRRSIPREIEKYLDALDSRRREQAGFPALERPYAEEDRKDDLDTLQSVIPAYRESPGWQTPEAKAFLADWEDELRTNLGKNRA